MDNALRDKKILVTAGPTWVPIDAVRVISNISSGRTGAVIAQYAAKKGANVTLLLGPSDAVHNSRLRQGLRVVRFRYFDEFRNLISRELKKQKYDIIIHAAAVSDYRPARIFKQKIKSGKKGLTIFLKPTVKLIDRIRKNAPQAFLVMFKLEAGKPKKELIDIAYATMRRCRADLVIANDLKDISKNSHRAYIVDAQKRITPVATKEKLAAKLFGIISKKGAKM